MSHTWKLLPLAAFAVIGAFVLFAGSGAVRPSVVHAAHENTITVEVDTDPEGGTNYDFTSSGPGSNCDEDFSLNDNGSHDLEDCANGTNRITVDPPSGSDLKSISCAVDDDGDTDGNDTTFAVDVDEQEVVIEMDDDEHVTCLFDFDYEPTTPTSTATSTAGAARTVVVTSANQALGCANTTIITISVKGANGQAVAAGTAVNITASIGAVSPTSGQTTADGSVFVFYTAPQNQGGTATITALAGSASGTANITINCNVAPTQAPPPTTAPSTGITPPSTGDGGLSSGSSWTTYAGIAMILVSVIGTLVVVRPRA